MKILVYDVFRPKVEVLEKFDALFVDVDTLFKESNVISLHCPLTE
jgi:lactate dehydrogenase-like 2-hydroxyacid dehydrogenase